MESERTSQSERTSRKRKHDRRLWTFAEEQALLAAMMESICDKYRAHNGFKPGYFNEVKKELKKILPGTTLKAQPNIESKVKNWKVQYAVILDITRLSGFGWNHTTNSIVVDDENVWKEYEKSNPKAKGLNGKSFPMCESWQFLFGRDRATGELAEDAAEVEEVVETYQNDANIEVDDMLNECYTPTFANGDTVFPRDTPFVDMSTSSGTPTSNAIPAAPRTNANTPRSNANTPTSNVVPGRPKKKAKVDANEASMHVAIANLLGESNTAFNKIADAVGYEDRLSAKREKVFTELMKLDLEMIDRFALNTMIVSAEENVDTFYGIPENYKQVCGLFSFTVYGLFSAGSCAVLLGVILWLFWGCMLDTCVAAVGHFYCSFNGKSGPILDNDDAIVIVFISWLGAVSLDTIGFCLMQFFCISGQFYRLFWCFILAVLGQFFSCFLAAYVDSFMDCFGAAFWQFVGQCYYHGSSWLLLLLFRPLPVLVFCTASCCSANVMALGGSGFMVFRASNSVDFTMTIEDKQYYWVVFVGHNPGIYTSWETAELQVNGYPGNLKKRYNTFDEAEGALLQFHEERYRLNQMQSVRTEHQSTDDASTSTSSSQVQRQQNLSTCFVVGIFLVWFRNDLRVHDNETLNSANNDSGSVLPVYCFDPRDYGKSSTGFDKTGPYRASFLIESVSDLRKNLRERGSDLIVRIGKPESVLVELIKETGADAVYAHREVSHEEVKAEEKIEEALKDEGVEVKYFWGSTLYHVDDLPFKLEEMPTNYGGFKEKVQGLEIRKTIEALDQLKGLPSMGDIEVGEIRSLVDLAGSLPKCYIGSDHET
ncbi:hypothetical protein RHMOL_Rhmol11G0086700 [Rhododendron molle]|uniref:Uncharacterized protein n=1 Tax=Rhododendron molle TaxID=49168 RepID=A0ACC0LQG5_RHOML|nr:hypothetical protein RHMOL_Rhmol11G0086700 [Rhododendron molle]